MLAIFSLTHTNLYQKVNIENEKAKYYKGVLKYL